MSAPEKHPAPLPVATQPAAQPVLCTPAWLMAGYGHNVPGALAAGNGRLAFHTADGPAFSVSVGELGEVSWPWWWFGGGCVLRVGGEKFKITFVRPNGAESVAGELLADATGPWAVVGGAADLFTAATALGSIRDGRRWARAWRQVLPA